MNITQLLRNMANCIVVCCATRDKDESQVEPVDLRWTESANLGRAALDLDSIALREADKLFDQLDLDKSGKLEPSELERIDSKLKSMGFVNFKIDLSRHDTNKDGMLDTEEFRKAFIQQAMQNKSTLHEFVTKAPEFQPTVKMIWSRADADGNGSVDVNALYALVQGVYKEMDKEPMPEKDVFVLLRKHDANKDGVLQQQEFVLVFEEVFMELLIRGRVKSQFDNCDAASVTTNTTTASNNGTRSRRAKLSFR